MKEINKKVLKSREEKPGKKEDKNSCNDKKCPIHGKLKIRGRIFSGKVKSKKQRHVTIINERLVYQKKYERYKKKRRKMRAHLPKCMESEIGEGDLVKIGECRPLSKTIHFVVIKKLNKKNESSASKSK